ncbi:DNA polymerase III subunit gamma and tau [Nocardioides aurantiacus]|uniref:DNA polymerase III subunit gamma/tau n=1 Tax=Nocardioides aurantiacus TaxID=86796 RepID=A0A3N2CP33_9ACTN|nr:DNA polymerase III subunit gamma and tau [Nocardioides aurantiacus]ROR89283.1 DNA polymerase-3 subunit gamma/tau [Nocardioides aurantiacus]
MQSSLALYRRYRPETFAEVIGQDHVTEPLRAALAHNRVNHAYLFSGPRGCGKTTSARILARALNCERAPISDPCGECRSCVDLARGGPGSVDVIEIDAASHGGVDDARDLRERAFFAPVSSRYKVYIIDEAHMVSSQGFNALLKLVEEPPEHLKFIFATTEPEKVIATIRSRTHHYPFRLIPPRVLSDYLAELCTKEGVRIDAAALPLVVRAGAGSARDSLSVLDQLLGGAGPDGVTYEVATGLLGYTPDNLLDEVVDAFAAQDGAGVFGVVDKVIETGQDPRRFTEDLLRRLRDLVIVAAVPEAHASGLLDAPEDQAERLVAQAARFGRADLVRAADLVAAGLTEMRGATTPRLLLELLCAKVLLPGADHAELGVLARMDRLERRLDVAGSGPVDLPAARPVPRPEPTAPTAPRAEEPAPAAPRAEQPAPAAPRSEEPAHAGPRIPEEVAQRPSRGAGPDQPAPQPIAEPAADEAAPGQLSLADVRRLWPDLLEQVKRMRRFTWILLSQNAQVIAVDQRSLTVGFKTAGARDSFLGGGSEEILRQAAIDMVGADWKIETVVDSATDPGAQTAMRVTRPAVPDAPEPPSGPEPPDPGPAATAQAAPPRAGASEAARARIAATRGPGAPEGEQGPREDPDADAHRDDPSAADNGIDTTELLARELGATVIEDIPHS